MNAFYFIQKVDLWLQSGRLIDDHAGLDALRSQLAVRLKDGDTALLNAFKRGVAHPETCTDAERIDKMTQQYRPVEMRRISLPSKLQPLTAGARIVNSPSYLLDKMKVGYDNAQGFLKALPYTLPN